MLPMLERAVPLHWSELRRDRPGTLVTLIVAVTVVAALASGAFVGKHAHARRPLTPAQANARAHMRTLALVAFPAWQRDHPDRACVMALSELAPYTRDVRSHDPWGRPYDFDCPILAGKRVLWIMSSGADGRFRTEDDVTSYRPYR